MHGCGITLSVMLVGAYPLEDPEDPKKRNSGMLPVAKFINSKVVSSSQKINTELKLQKVLSVQYWILGYVHISRVPRPYLRDVFW